MSQDVGTTPREGGACVQGPPSHHRRRPRGPQASELKLLHGIQGYAASLAAVRGYDRRGEAWTDIGTLIDRYLADTGLAFEEEVSRKPARRLRVTSWLNSAAAVEKEAS